MPETKSTIQVNGVDVPAWVANDAEWASAVWLLTWLSSCWSRISPFVDFDDGAIRFDLMVEIPLSSGEITVIRVAWSLYNNNWARRAGETSGLGDLAWIGDKHAEACLAALQIRLGNMPITGAKAVHP